MYAFITRRRCAVLAQTSKGHEDKRSQTFRPLRVVKGRPSIPNRGQTFVNKTFTVITYNLIKFLILFSKYFVIGDIRNVLGVKI